LEVLSRPSRLFYVVYKRASKDSIRGLKIYISKVVFQVTRYPLGRRLGELQSRYGRFGEEKNRLATKKILVEYYPDTDWPWWPNPMASKIARLQYLALFVMGLLEDVPPILNSIEALNYGSGPMQNYLFSGFIKNMQYCIRIC
jgi:hypothetical protein